MKSKGAILIYFGFMLIVLYVGVMMVQWYFAIAVGFVATTLLMVYFYLMRNKDEVLERAWRSIGESWPTMLLWQRAIISFIFPVAFMLTIWMVIADNNLDKKAKEKRANDSNDRYSINHDN